MLISLGFDIDVAGSAREALSKLRSAGGGSISSCSAMLSRSEI